MTNNIFMNRNICQDSESRQLTTRPRVWLRPILTLPLERSAVIPELHIPLQITSGHLSSILLEDILQYHVLQGTYQASDIPENETFVPTGLMMGEFANVTGGQRVGVVREGDNVTVFSGGLANSSVTQAV